MMTTDATKYLDNNTPVDLNKSRKLWDNDKSGDSYVSLWADTENKHVWLETNGDPVYGEDSLIEALIAEGVPADAARAAAIGDLAWFETS